MARRSKARPAARGSSKRVRYAVVGLGHIAQAAVLPAFRHASRNSELVALVSGEPRKLRSLGRRYNVEHLCSYEELDALLEGDGVDAVYLALPNNLHRDFAIRAVRGAPGAAAEVASVSGSGDGE